MLYTPYTQCYIHHIHNVIYTIYTMLYTPYTQCYIHHIHNVIYINTYICLFACLIIKISHAIVLYAILNTLKYLFQS